MRKRNVMIAVILSLTMLVGSNVFASEFTEEIYQKNNMDVMTIDDEAQEEVVDIAYQNMINRESYIVELISSYSGIETTMADWEYNLEYLKIHYDDLMMLEDINQVYVNLYIEDYEIVQATRHMPKTQVNEIRNKASYSWADAVSYAEKYYSTYNSSYPDWSAHTGNTKTARLSSYAPTGGFIIFHIL